MLVAQEQVSSGKKVEKPSDDPEAAADIIRITGQQALNDQFTKNLNTAAGRLTAADNALNSVQDMINQIRTLGLQGLDPTSDASASTAEITGLSDQIMATANQTSNGRYIFGGSVTTTPPYVKNQDGSVSYVGNSKPVSLQVGRDTTLQAQIPGDQIFSGQANVFSAISSLVTAMKAGDQSAISAQVDQLEQVFQQTSTARSTIGGYVNVATSLQGQLTNDSLSNAQDLNNAQSADPAKAITNLTLAQTNYQATLAVGAKISQLSLLDYLR
jgi:flagellar hook-associated protein 3 FlgL